MNEINDLEGLRVYAAMINTLDASRIEPILADDFVYESQAVFQPLESKRSFMKYITQKLETIRRANVKVFAELGRVDAYGREQPCVILAQDTPENLIGLVLAKTEEGKLKRLDLCIVPSPQTAQRLGDYPR